MIEKMDSLKRTVFEVLIGILVFGILFEIPGLFFAKEKFFYTAGLLLGMVLAAAMIIHMAFNINDAMDWDEEHAAKTLKKGAVIRYGAVLLVSMLAGYFKFVNIIALWLGIMTLKASVYMQPFVHKTINKILKIEERGYENAVIDDDDDDELDLGQWPKSRFYDPWSN